MTLIAINVLLLPDAATAEKTLSTNARLLKNYPAGFALDANHAPHITLVQQFVHTKDLAAVANAVAAALSNEQPAQWQSMATGFYDMAYKNLGLVGIVIEPTAGLRRLQQTIIAAVAPFAVDKGTAEAFAPRADGESITQATVDYVNNFVGSSSGINYHPHLTCGIGNRDFVDALKAEPFEPISCEPIGVSIYQIGDYGTAQIKLYDFANAG
ncbi:MAG: 2'-5' RNA ligase family protein [Cyanobium sp. 49614_E6]|nr:2'-5' RNA ligase family protein [Cyanobium sp. 49614_E6]